MKYKGLREFLPRIKTGPLGLRNALDAALRYADDRTYDPPHPNQVSLLFEHTGGWFGLAHEVRQLLKDLGYDEN
jgi:hypothetical protein